MKARLRGNPGTHPLFSGVLALMLVVMMAAGAVLTSTPSVARAQTATDTIVGIVPDSALVYINVDLNPASAQWTQASALMQQLGATGSVEDLLTKAIAEESDNPAIAMGAIQPFIGGQGALVITSLAAAERVEAATGMGTLGGLIGNVLPAPATATTSDETEGSGVAFIAQPTDVNQAWTTVQGLLQSEASDAGATIAEDTYNGVAIQSIPAIGEDSEGVAIAQLGEFLIVTTTPAEVHPFVDVQQGQAAALSSADSFTRLQSELSGDHLLFGYINGPGLVELGLSDEEFASSLEAAGGLDPEATEQLKQYGGFTIAALPQGFRVDGFALSASGVAPVTLPENFEAQLPNQVPATTALMVSGANLGASGALDQVALVFLEAMMGTGFGDEGTPVETPTPDEVFANSAAMLGFNLKTEFIDQLVGEFGIAVWGLEGLDPSQVNALIVSGAQDSATLNNTLARLSFLVQAAAQGEISVTNVEVPGGSVNQIDLTEAVGMPAKLEYGVVGQQLLIGYNDAIAQYQSGSPDNLASNPTYQAAMAQLPSDHYGVFFVNLEQLIPIAEQGAMVLGSDMGTEPPDLSALRALAGVGYTKGDLVGGSVFILIGN